MYSPTLIQHKSDLIEARTGRQLTRRAPSEIDDWLARLSNATDDKGALTRPLTSEEQNFIIVEQMLCAIDFRYWAENYGTIYRDGAFGGGIGRPVFWQSQEIALSRLAAREEQLEAAERAGEVLEGILMVWHKARQLGATMFARLLLMHRMTLTKDFRAISASVDDDKIMELYDRDKLIYDRLPFYLKPVGGFDVKGEHFYLDGTNSHVLYQQASQKSGMGTGRQFEGGHLTELSSWQYAHKMVEMDFFPTIPQSRYSLHVLESTADGRGNWWHEFSEDVRAGNRPNWVYIFVPWYAEEGKYRRTPPSDWRPSRLSELHAKKVWETSMEFIGRRVRLSREQLYWYESERAAYQRQGTLNIFLSNWCADPLESFQHSGQSAFPPEFLERARLEARAGAPHEVVIQ